MEPETAQPVVEQQQEKPVETQPAPSTEAPAAPAESTESAEKKPKRAVKKRKDKEEKEEVEDDVEPRSGSRRSSRQKSTDSKALNFNLNFKRVKISTKDEFIAFVKGAVERINTARTTADAKTEAKALSEIRECFQTFNLLNKFSLKAVNADGTNIETVQIRASSGWPLIVIFQGHNQVDDFLENANSGTSFFLLDNGEDVPFFDLIPKFLFESKKPQGQIAL
jgi:hypothetical protein